MAENFIKVIMATMLLICSVQDVLKKKIFLSVILIGAVLIATCIPFCSKIIILYRVSGAAIGITVIIISFATAGKIGMGDAFLLCVTGLGLGFWENLELFAIALFLASIISILLLILRLANRKKSIPFVPFMLISYLFLIFSGR